MNITQLSTAIIDRCQGLAHKKGVTVYLLFIR